MSFRVAAAMVKNLRLLEPSQVLSASSEVALHSKTARTLQVLPSKLMASSDPLAFLFSLDDGEYLVKRSTMEGILGPESGSARSMPTGHLSSSSTTTTATSTTPTTTNSSANSLAIPQSVLSSHSFTLLHLLQSTQASHPQLDLKTIKTPDIPKSENFNLMSKTDTVFFQACANCDVPTLTEECSRSPKIASQATHSIHGGCGLHVVAMAYNSSPASQVQTIEYLVSQNAELDAVASNGSTALHWAAGNGNADVVRCLLDLGADPNVKSYTWQRQVFGKSSGQTPLHWASESGEQEVINMLCDANPLALLSGDERGSTAAELAEKALHFDAEALLHSKLEEPYVVLQIKKEVEGTKVL
ncbi:hypothetical protein TrVE_jg4423 [Triparma verrucosa]|uniref:Uncharacterized protein n=1 Tax=Triparma verrucosa TaxID=1606542 RepID=A0A9W7EQL3_9STRA|nr:hypothetical protein TrVE_jg4423 [Triparma verrucosa]